jgi:hypothetical protein
MRLDEKIKHIWKKIKRPSLALTLSVPLAFGAISAMAQNTYDVPKLAVFVPGINSNGEQMLENAKKEFRYDPECDKTYYFKDYKIEIDPDKTVLDALKVIPKNLKYCIDHVLSLT